MSFSFRPAAPSPESRTALFYLTVFAIPGAIGAYLGIWLSDKGLSAGEIGWINSVPVFLTLLFNMSVGRLADRARDWRTVIIIGAMASALMPAGLFFVEDFWGLLAVVTLVLLPFNLVMPVIDAAAIRMTRRNGTNFAFVRAFGTVGFMLSLAGFSLVVAMFGGGAYVPAMLAVTILRALLSLPLPRFRAPSAETAPDAPLADPPPAISAAPGAAAPLAARRLGAVMTPWFLAPVLAFALVQGLHYSLNAFGGIIWRDNGIAEGLIGPLLALGAASEVMVMFGFKRFAGRLGARHLILIAMLVSAVRWGCMSLGPPLWVLALLQLTHGITFGFAYLGLMNFIANWTSEDVAAEAQSFATVVQLGVAVASLSSFGYLVDFLGNHGFAAGVVFSLLAAGLIVWSLRLMPTSEGVAASRK